MSPSKLVYRGLATVLTVVAVTAQVVLIHRGGGGAGQLQPTFLPLMGMGVVDSFVAAALALLLVYGSDGRRGTHALGLCLASWSYVLAYSGVVALLQPSGPGLVRTLFEAHFPLVEALGLAGAIRFSVVFPAPVLPGHLVPPRSVPFGLRTLQRLRVALVEPSTPWVAALVAVALLLGVNALSGGVLQEAPLNPLAALIRFGALAAVVLNVRVSWLHARGRDRTRITWMFAGLTLLVACLGVLIGGNVLQAVTGWHIPLADWRPTVLDLSLLSLLWGVAMAIWYGGPVDPGRVAERAAVLGGAMTVALFLAAGLEALFSDILVGRLTLPRGVGTAIAVVVTALAYRRARVPLEGSLAQIWSGDEESATLEPRVGA